MADGEYSTQQTKFDHRASNFSSLSALYFTLGILIYFSSL